MIYGNEDVFISYSSANHAVALEIKKRLESPPRNVTCWMANNANIQSGEDFRSKIVDAIKRCKIFLFVISKESMESKWCPLELSYAILENKKIYSIRVDSAQLSPSFEFKLICSQISDGTSNLDVVIETLAINVKNQRDEILTQEQRKISDSKKYNIGGYLFCHIVSLILGIAIIASIAVAIVMVDKAGGIMAFLSESSNSDISKTAIKALSIVLYCIVPYVIFISLKNLKLKNLQAGASIDSPSALYTQYLIMTRYSLLFIIFGRKVALEKLQKSAELGYAPAKKEMKRLSK
ncbi:MAG: toll/interleukin-1 receptor domain-containing protein [Clostridia bacterium]|nr:toll/interleukin-1 receptor domain-containing protein [Clostridia bacterium]